jgi:ribosomal protein S18 acetylase RimI-like enzyme
MGEKVVRLLEPSDAGVYQALRRSALVEVPEFVGPSAEREARCEAGELRARMVSHRAEGIYRFGCFVDGTCAGVAAQTQNPNPRYSHKVFFWGLYVAPAFRRQAVAGALMEHRLAFARSLPGVKFVMLQVTTSNHHSRRLHERHGFVSCGIEPGAMRLEDGRMFDFELMQLRL